MKRYHQNLTNETIVFRTWMLTKEELNQSDFLWLHGFGISIRVEQPTHTFDTIGGRTHSVYGKRTVTLDSTTDKQRDMIVLKYGNEAVLMQEEIVFPGTLSTCTLDRIDWQ
jgi:hypothetical protein